MNSLSLFFSFFQSSPEKFLSFGFMLFWKVAVAAHGYDHFSFQPCSLCWRALRILFAWIINGLVVELESSGTTVQQQQWVYIRCFIKSIISQEAHPIAAQRSNLQEKRRRKSNHFLFTVWFIVRKKEKKK